MAGRSIWPRDICWPPTASFIAKCSKSSPTSGTERWHQACTLLRRARTRELRREQMFTRTAVVASIATIAIGLVPNAARAQQTLNFTAGYFSVRGEDGRDTTD